MDYMQYFRRLTELSLCMFEWKNLPETVDPRYMELALFHDGKAVFFEDEVVGFVCLRCATAGVIDIYDVPIERRAVAANGLNVELDNTNSVIIYNNFVRTNSALDVMIFSKRLYNIDMTIDVNVNAQKTPILVSCEETQRLTLKNLYAKYTGNEPVIYGDKSIRPDSLKVLQTGAPYVAEQLYNLKQQIWNEALTYLGIANTNTVKKERLISTEVMSQQGGVVANRYGRLEARRQACEQINRMFGTDIWVDYRTAGVIDEETTGDDIVNGEGGDGEDEPVYD